MSLRFNNLSSRSFSLRLHRWLMNLPLLRNSLHSTTSILLMKHFFSLPQNLSLLRIIFLPRFLLFLLTHFALLRIVPLPRFLRYLIPPLNRLIGLWLLSPPSTWNWLLLLSWHLLFLPWILLLPLLLMRLQPPTVRFDSTTSQPSHVSEFTLSTPVFAASSVNFRAPFSIYVFCRCLVSRWT